MARKSRKSNESFSVVQEPKYRVALYARLSVETKRKIEADTIGTQVEFLKNFISEKKDLELCDIYCDDDITGTHFARPEFERMMYDVRNGRINCIVVKDLSRFGRNHLEVGNYLENVFPLGVSKRLCKPSN